MPERRPTGGPESARVHVWVVDLDRAAGTVGRFGRVLCEAERERARRFVFGIDRSRYIAAHGALRTVIASYLNQEPAALRFGVGGYGKPCLEGLHAATGLRFNMSRSGALALVAVARDREVGIDIERLRPVQDPLEIARRYFSARDIERLRAVLPARRDEAFLTCWTLKEAYVKAIGEGLRCPLSSFDIPFVLGESSGALNVAGRPQDAGCWTGRSLRPHPAYVAAVIAEGRDCQVWMRPLAGDSEPSR